MNTLNYIEKLTSIPSPTGYTNEIVSYLKQEIESFGYETFKTNKGALMVSVSGKDNERHRVVTAHVDTLGAIVRSIKPNGRLKIDLVGGFVYNSIEGENCIVHVNKNNNKISGTILMHQISVHVYKDASTAERNQDNIEIRLDAKTSSKKETEDLGIQVGDFISFDPRTIITETGFIKSRHLDDKVSAAILINQLKKIKEENIELPHTTHFYFSNNEEIGYGANSSIPKETVEYLAVDMGAMGDDQQTDEFSVSICVKDSSGPYNFDFKKNLIELCEKNNIPYKLDIYPRYGSDASAAMSAGVDVKHALFGAGIESSHAYERTHKDSIVATEKLVEVYINSEME
ncbi:M42 family metallopeptidase [Helcococcus sueciensis]|uniref:M42 family metallopeptidase n=1 Tax=Helcococcus sueciensis TaxID=241555 RepID=UPI000406BDDF|nr:M42 family metallopeptidase [Helcococcus sueciensis]